MWSDPCCFRWPHLLPFSRLFTLIQPRGLLAVLETGLTLALRPPHLALPLLRSLPLDIFMAPAHFRQVGAQRHLPGQAIPQPSA